MTRKNYWAIAEEMIRVVEPEVVMGAGHPGFDGHGSPAGPQYKYLSPEDYRLLNREGNSGGGPYLLVEKPADFLNLIKDTGASKVFGLVQNRNGLKPGPADGSGEASKSPTLKDLTQGALRVSSRKPGILLMVEGGAIDRGHHLNDLNLAIGETLGFQDAVQAVVDSIENPRNTRGGWDNNLLIVTADHETGYLAGSNPKGRGSFPAMSIIPRTHQPAGRGLVQGSGMEFFQKYLKGLNDFERGAIQVIDNTEIHKVMEECLQGEPATTNQ